MRLLALRFVLGGALIVGVATTTADAGAADVQACMSAFEKGQQMKNAGKLRAARELFVSCGQTTCPALIRHDCAEFNSKLNDQLPTVVFGAHDKQGRDLFDVTVSMDGEVLIKKLDGKAVTVDPGKHAFKFEYAGLPPQTETALIKEGEHSRVINVTFDSGKDEPTGVSDAGGGKGKDEKEAEPREHSVAPWIVVGLGAVGVAGGLVVALTAPDRPSNCDAVTKLCKPDAEHPASGLQADRDQAGRADSQPVIGYVIAGVGGALVVGGLVWHFLEPTDPPKKTETGRLRFSPWTTGQASGVTFGGRF